MSSIENRQIITSPVERADEGRRLDQFLAEQAAKLAPDLSRQRLQALISQGKVFQQINNTPEGTPLTKQNYRVKSEQVFIIQVPPPEAYDVVAEDIPIEILYEDKHLVVVNKPSDMATHPAPGSMTGTLVHALLHHCAGKLSGIGGVERPGIVHRLDKGTSGVMVIAKDDISHQHLAQQFKDRTLDRRYWAVCYGELTLAAGEIEGNIGRNPQNRKKMAVLSRGGKHALTNYALKGTSEYGFSFVELKLQTGRTHQIRVHMTHLGHPLVGDPLYGRKRQTTKLPEDVAAAVNEFPRQALHAFKLSFEHPITHEILTFETELPDDMKKLVSFLQVKTSR